MRRRALLKAGLAQALAGAAPVAAKAASLSTSQPPTQGLPSPFGIHVVDAQTGRGIPLVALKTVNNVTYITDSGGYAAIADPGLLHQRVYFSIASDGYTFTRDGFGYCGRAFDVRPNAVAVIKLHRTNIAQRLYRITGEGIYRDTLLLGRRAPTAHPLLNGGVMGQDSALAAVYKGKIHWIWGDTNRASYPLGNFRSSGAVSALPGHGGLDPARGIDLDYFIDKTGFCRAMCPLPGQPGGVVWLDGLSVVSDGGAERLVARYSRRDGLAKLYEHGLALWDDHEQVFKKHNVYPFHDTWRFPTGHPAPWHQHAREYRLFSPQFPTVRVLATLPALANPAAYEAYTCLAPGTRFRGAHTRLDRAAGGAVRWAWKRNTAPISSQEEAQLLAAGLMHPREAHYQLHDIQTHRPLTIHNGSFFWNQFRKRWIMIAVETGGASPLGEVWFATAAAATGPWTAAQKIATHPHYSFYNPAQNPFFDQQGGRLIYFQGTWSTTFSGNTHPTPRYDYNQLMYCLDLADNRLRAV